MSTKTLTVFGKWSNLNGARKKGDRKMREKAEGILMDIGISANLKGFRYIVDIMELFDSDIAWREAKTMILYEKVAMMHNTTYGRVERAIRYAFSHGITYGNLELVEKYLSMMNITNGNLLHTLYTRIKEEMKQERVVVYGDYEEAIEEFFKQALGELLHFREKCMQENGISVKELHI